MKIKFKTDTNKWNFHFIIRNRDYITERTLLYVGWFDDPNYFEQTQIKASPSDERELVICYNFLKRYLRYKHDF